MEIPKCKCKGCPDRTVEPNCHMTCQSYLDFVAYNEKQKALEVERKRQAALGNSSTRAKAIERKRKNRR